MSIHAVYVSVWSYGLQSNRLAIIHVFVMSYTSYSVSNKSLEYNILIAIYKLLLSFSITWGYNCPCCCGLGAVGGREGRGLDGVLGEGWGGGGLGRELAGVHIPLCYL